MMMNGVMMKNDVIEAFNKAVNNKENQYEGGGMNWDFVDADLNIELGMFYSADYLNECVGILVDNYYA